MPQTWTVRSILQWIEGYLARHNDKNPRLSAQWLVADVLGCERLDLYLDMDRPLQPDELSRLHDYTARRAKGEPLQYIVGATTFRKISVRVAKGVLIPRPETEVLVSAALEEVTPKRALDLCTGSGCIACSLAYEVAGCHVVATDVSDKAIELAKTNVEALKLNDRVEVYQGDLGEAVPKDYLGTFDLVISNPPYVPTDVLGTLDHEVSDFEPRLALDGGTDGLDLFRRIVPFAYKALNDDGVFACELFETALEPAQRIAHNVGFPFTHMVKDLAGHPRILIARKTKKDLDDLPAQAGDIEDTFQTNHTAVVNTAGKNAFEADA